MSQTLTNNPISLTKLMKRGEELMVKIVVCVFGNSWYYDHALMEIEEGKLIDEVGAFVHSTR